MRTDLFCTDALTPETVLAELQHSVGEAHGRTAEELVLAITGRNNTADLRRLRQVIEALSSAGHAVCANPAHGYYMAANDRELDRACNFLLGRALTTLRRVYAMKRVAMPDLRGQLGLPLEPTP
jgi:hypothetical protein